MINIPYYLGGYQIIKLKPINYGALKGETANTCSGCINFSIFDSWAQSWTKQNLDQEQKQELKLDEQKIIEIQKWTEAKFENLANLFTNLEDATAFKNCFLSDIPDLEIYSINFSEKDKNLLIEEFAEGMNTETFNYNNGDFNLRKNLLKNFPENKDEIFLGFDLIGVECDGSFHSFICTNASEELKVKFGLGLNEYGLFDTINDSDELRNFLLDEKFFEPVPYYICKVKKLIS